jgi:hypothetical protein
VDARRQLMKLLHQLDDTLEYSIAMPALRAPLGTAGRAAWSASAMRVSRRGHVGTRCGFRRRVRGKTRPTCIYSTTVVLMSWSRLSKSAGHILLVRQV